MTTDYELHNMFDVLNKAKKRLANFGTTTAQRGRANTNETARFEAGGGEVGTAQGGRNALGVVSAPSKTKPVVTPKKPAKPVKPKKAKKPKAKVTPKVIDGRPKAKKPVKPKKAKKPKTKPFKAGTISTGMGASQEGVDPSGARARAVYVNPKSKLRGDAKRRAAARAASRRASPTDTYESRKLQNQLGVRGVRRPTKPKKKATCPLWKTELNETFNTLLDNFQQLYK